MLPKLLTKRLIPSASSATLRLLPSVWTSKAAASPFFHRSWHLTHGENTTLPLAVPPFSAICHCVPLTKVQVGTASTAASSPSEAAAAAAASDISPPSPPSLAPSSSLAASGSATSSVSVHWLSTSVRVPASPDAPTSVGALGSTSHSLLIINSVGGPANSILMFSSSCTRTTSTSVLILKSLLLPFAQFVELHLSQGDSIIVTGPESLAASAPSSPTPISPASSSSAPGWSGIPVSGDSAGRIWVRISAVAPPGIASRMLARSLGGTESRICAASLGLISCKMLAASLGLICCKAAAA
mmetsp:Transcript_11113/g.28119  ORF Transcript_11113/g.28119 Transcript_11113/m.28119 type:complete len:299 (-) Transcript_11113:303-1199(-)